MIGAGIGIFFFFALALPPLKSVFPFRNIFIFRDHCREKSEAIFYLFLTLPTQLLPVPITGSYSPVDSRLRTGCQPLSLMEADIF